MIKLILLAAASVFYFSNPTTILSAWYNANINSSHSGEVVVGVAVPPLPTTPGSGIPIEGSMAITNPVASAHVATIAPNTGEVVHATVVPINTTKTNGTVNLSANTGTSNNGSNPLAHVANTANITGTTPTNNAIILPTTTVATNPADHHATNKVPDIIAPNTNVQEPPRFDVITSINNPQQRRFSLKLKLVNPTPQTYSDASARVTLPPGIEVLQEMQFKKSTRGVNSIWCKFDPVAAHAEQACECMLIADRDGKFTLKIETRLNSQTKGKVSEEMVELRSGN